jgi:hypothetical protein
MVFSCEKFSDIINWKGFFMAIDWKIELQAAELARQAGNEGQARVCARRAAGEAARDFLNRRGVRLRTTSAYDALRALEQLPNLAPDLRLAASKLTLRVTEEFVLPVEADLLVEAKKLIEGLENNGAAH